MIHVSAIIDDGALLGEACKGKVGDGWPQGCVETVKRGGVERGDAGQHMHKHLAFRNQVQ